MCVLCVLHILHRYSLQTMTTSPYFTSTLKRIPLFFLFPHLLHHFHFSYRQSQKVISSGKTNMFSFFSRPFPDRREGWRKSFFLSCRTIVSSLAFCTFRIVRNGKPHYKCDDLVSTPTRRSDRCVTGPRLPARFPCVVPSPKERNFFRIFIWGKKRYLRSRSNPLGFHVFFLPFALIISLRRCFLPSLVFTSSPHFQTRGLTSDVTGQCEKRSFDHWNSICFFFPFLSIRRWHDLTIHLFFITDSAAC